jgi:hypothetical protein
MEFGVQGLLEAIQMPRFGFALVAQRLYPGFMLLGEGGTETVGR